MVEKKLLAGLNMFNTTGGLSMQHTSFIVCAIRSFNFNSSVLMHESLLQFIKASISFAPPRKIADRLSEYEGAPAFLVVRSN